MRDVPYYTTEDESKYCGHVWKQRDRIGGQWGFMWEVLPPDSDGDDPIAGGWCPTQQAAETRMHDELKKHQK